MAKKIYFLMLSVFLLIFNSNLYAVQINDFIGVNGSPKDNHLNDFNIKWIRIDFSWKNIEKVKGQYNWGYYDKILKLANEKGYKVLPILAYTPSWAGEHGQSSIPYNKNEWTDFVDAIVKRYSRPPYNIKFYQIWNEPTKKAGFWKGTNDEFLDIIYLPAAKLIKAHGGEVVFGGWPISNSINELIKLLTTKEAYKYTDIIDVHYSSIAAYNKINNNFLEKGLVKGIWQTEIGYKNKPFFLITEYTKILSWVIKHNWNNENKYKVFWFPFFSNKSDYTKALYGKYKNHDEVTTNGKELLLFTKVFSGGDIIRIDNVKPYLNSFAVNINENKIVYAIFNDEFNSLNSEYYAVEFTKKIDDAKLYCADGEIHNYTDYVQEGRRLYISLTKTSISSYCPNAPLVYIVLKQ